MNTSSTPTTRDQAGTPAGTSLVDTEATLRVEKVAHGGHFVARHEGQVVFVRHALPGETVRVRFTKGAVGDRFVFADAVRIEEPAPERVASRCPVAGPGGCGGCDFQHVDLHHQRELKAQVVAEQLSRLAGIERQVTVEPVPGDSDGLRWRTRMELAVNRAGQAGLRRFRSREVIPLDACPIAVEEVAATGVFGRRWPGLRGVDVVVPSTGKPKVVRLPRGARKAGTVTERVDVPPSEHHPGFTERFTVPTRGFWQVHPGAAATLVGAVLDGTRPHPGERALDLYAGVGLFAAALAAQVGTTGQVVAVESDPASAAAAVRSFADTPAVEVVTARTDVALAKGRCGQAADVVVLDPPRSGAGAETMQQIMALRPRVIAYVACDPAALARDLRTAGDGGYELAALRAFDMFPMTHHVECVAILEPQGHSA